MSDVSNAHTERDCVSVSGSENAKSAMIDRLNTMRPLWMDFWDSQRLVENIRGCSVLIDKIESGNSDIISRLD